MTFNRRCLMAGAAASLAAPPALAQTWPNRPIRLVIPFPPGGGTDICGRILGARLGEVLGQPVVVDNRAGAGSMIGTRAVGQSPPDGYTLLFNGTSSIVRDGFDPRSAVHHVARAAITHNILVVNRTVPVADVPAFIAWLRARPGQVNHGTAGPLTSQHLAAVMFDLLAGTRMENVHYRGTGPSVAGILGNEVQVMFGSFSAVFPLVQEGQLRALGTASARKSIVLPSLPTMGEFLPGYAAELTYSFCTPLGTPAPIERRLEEAVRRVLADENTARAMATNGFEPYFESGESLNASIDRDMRRWADVLQQAGIRLDQL
ncbi:tripartite tricarboxylate transporter substrate binding protein [Roseococcus sp. SYP-B2431]|uniref:Bug family tripartite tricarboxylate transporter substrate binding protein n=1 Tax=Roseococcus sp. SYP-B2431 TaxID=2496640 RepID=UPI00103D8594|nr:tripartite tricarboxylate transporter substrate binding protein [Roseococcus sp. SYP-B2431]TCH97032.1 tripartite tricarboxylate transporter substrate binding protein [Roseococcus sp. SYP-B2431]